MKEKKILIIDDEPVILNSFKKDFEYEGYNVHIAENGAKGIELLKNNFFNLVITDLSMPEIDGIMVLEEAKKIDNEICVIVLTGYGNLNSAISALQLGASDYLLKPCDNDEILLRMERCLKEQELRKKIKIYEKFLSICSYCKKIRDDSGCPKGEGHWVSFEAYISDKGGVDLSHGICPECYGKISKKI